MWVSVKLVSCAVLLMLFTSGLCQSDSRRAVSEHQLMHDRGRTVQSLKRLIWLSSAIEGLHTAQARGLDPGLDHGLGLDQGLGLDHGLGLDLDLRPDTANMERMKSLLREFFKSVKQ
ncbi:hypothetical protein NQD34_007819 [Periophthalmus magnuspinnatus]|uniref:parathyroid hormone 4 n=1 Tax=Periophthalmus magnuspinnatus TaxID=409849 RepID=UPI0022C99B43|nr:parathyroid hormone 4 [Periophthalmus magnuspinnatus]KAJ0002670.1 hypothetical protein NQD34_007819 [Periophthalmus magnuspinnatus]